MDDALLKYDQSLEALEKQRVDLARVMERMGAEWEESGAGVGWLGDNLFKEPSSSSSDDISTISPPPLMSLMHCVTSSEPSHDYLQSLLNVNDELLAQSLASTSDLSNFSHISSSSSQANSSPLVKHTFLPPQQVLPISPTSPENDNIGDKASLQQQPQIIQITQFTPPITPE